MSGAADEIGIAFIRLMGRQHIVVSRNDTDIGPSGQGEIALVVHRSVSVGLVSAGQMCAAGTILGSTGDFRQISAATLERPFANPVGDAIKD